jgi:hypothetical protein
MNRSKFERKIFIVEAVMRRTVKTKIMTFVDKNIQVDQDQARSGATGSMSRVVVVSGLGNFEVVSVSLSTTSLSSRVGICTLSFAVLLLVSPPTFVSFVCRENTRLVDHDRPSFTMNASIGASPSLMACKANKPLVNAKKINYML